MPNRYEREIEEILNRMEESEPNKGAGDRIRPFRRPKPKPVRPHGLPTPRIALLELLFLIAIFLLLVAAGLAFYESGPTLISGAIAAAGLLLFVVALVAGWRDHFRPSTTPRWREHALDHDQDRDSDHPPRGPLDSLAGRIRIWRLRQQYRRGQALRDDLDD